MSRTFGVKAAIIAQMRIPLVKQEWPLGNQYEREKTRAKGQPILEMGRVTGATSQRPLC
jgi:hypothetical protein